MKKSRAAYGAKLNVPKVLEMIRSGDWEYRAFTDEKDQKPKCIKEDTLCKPLGYCGVIAWIVWNQNIKGADDETD